MNKEDWEDYKHEVKKLRADLAFIFGTSLFAFVANITLGLICVQHSLAIDVEHPPPEVLRMLGFTLFSPLLTLIFALGIVEFCEKFKKLRALTRTGPSTKDRY